MTAARTRVPVQQGNDHGVERQAHVRARVHDARVCAHGRARPLGVARPSARPRLVSLRSHRTLAIDTLSHLASCSRLVSPVYHRPLAYRTLLSMSFIVNCKFLAAQGCSSWMELLF